MYILNVWSTAEYFLVNFEIKEAWLVVLTKFQLIWPSVEQLAEKKKHAFHLFKYFVSLHFLRISSKKNTIWIITWHINLMTIKWFINCCQILRIYTIPRYNNIDNTCIHKPTLLWFSTVYKFPYRKEFCQNKTVLFYKFSFAFHYFYASICKKKSKSLKFFSLKVLYLFFYATHETLSEEIELIWTFLDIALAKKTPEIWSKRNFKYGLGLNGKFCRSSF